MRGNRKNFTEEELDRLSPLDFADNFDCGDFPTIAKLEAQLDELDVPTKQSDENCSDEPSGLVLTSEPSASKTLPVASAVLPKAELGLSDVESRITEAPIAVRHLFRSTKRKARKYRPNCFGSHYLRDLDSIDCQLCEFSDGCSKTVESEKPIRDARMTALKAQFEPPSDLTPMRSMRAFYREYHLRKFYKSRLKRRQGDANYRRARRGSSSAQALIAKEGKKRLAALCSATAKPQKNKRIEQLRGREAMLMNVWAAQQHARLIYGPGASAAQVAKTFEKLSGRHFSRHQVRSYRILFSKLDKTLKGASVDSSASKTA